MVRVGVDIGSTEVRVVKLAGIDADGFARIARFGTYPVREGAVVGGRIHHPQQVSISLARALKEAGVPRHGFVVGISSTDAAVTRIRLPGSIRPDERPAALRHLGVEVSPTVPLEAAALATNLLRDTVTAEGFVQHQLIVAAVPEADLEVLRTVCKLARCTPAAIDLAGAATARAYVRAAGGNREVGAIVDIGATRTTVITREGLDLRSLRSSLGGGADLTHAIADALGVSAEEAETRKRAMAVIGKSTTVPVGPVGFGASYVADERAGAEQALVNAADLLVDQIAAHIELDAQVHGSMPAGVLLVGGGALMRGLKERVAKRVGVEVRIGRPWARLEPRGRNLAYLSHGKEDPALMLALATATGLALWRPYR